MMKTENKLYPFQVEGVEFLAARQQALLAYDMGLGKTVIAIATLNKLKAKKILIVCPASLKYNWLREFEKWSEGRPSIQVVEGKNAHIERNVNIIIINYDLLLSRTIFFQLKEMKFAVGVFDESHFMKNRDAKRTQMVLIKGGIASRCVHKWYLTGTPVLNRPVELYPILRANRPDVIAPYDSYNAFAKRYCGAYFDGFQLIARGATHIEELNKRLTGSGFMLRRTKAEVLHELPPKQFQIIPVEGKTSLKLETQKFNWSKKDLISKNLDELVAGAELGDLAKLRHELALDKLSSVIEHLKDLLEIKEKIVVFAHHRDILKTLMAHFDKFNPVVLMGGMNSYEKDQAVNKFQKDKKCRLFFGQIQAAGVGITLTSADIAVFAEISWVPGEIFQAVDRIHRIGQDRGVLIQFFVVAGSLEEYMLKTVIEKKETVERLLAPDVEEMFK